MVRKKVWDVVQPVDEWGRNYAHVAYLHEGLRQLFTKRITVTDGRTPLSPQVRQAIMVIEGFKV